MTGSAVLVATAAAVLGRICHMDSGFLALGLPPLVALFGAGLVVSAPTTSPLRAVLEFQPLRFFGTYSYGLYVWHGLLLPRFDVWFPTAAIQARLGSYTLAVLGHATLATAVSVAVAVASYHLFESPFLRLKFRFADRPLVVPKPHLSLADGARFFVPLNRRSPDPGPAEPPMRS